MLGLNLLMRLGRSVLKGPVTEAGLLPAKVYSHLVLAALEEEDFSGALGYLKWAQDPLLAQLLVLRLRLLSARHERQRQAILGRTAQAPPEKYQELLKAEAQALGLLKEYEGRALALAKERRPSIN
jgi:hypothetical protein